MEWKEDENKRGYSKMKKKERKDIFLFHVDLNLFKEIRAVNRLHNLANNISLIKKKKKTPSSDTSWEEEDKKRERVEIINSRFYYYISSIYFFSLFLFVFFFFVSWKQ